ncbi:hypothetical protein J7E70_02165 [Variovorax paradoxus]|nr:hypothetical protein [Variovorax paradoxus]MBT2299259.1 hypothetical protein [Variovorax paradoxus]
MNNKTSALAARALTLGAQNAGRFYRLGWVSLQSDESISVGLVDSALVLRDFEAKKFVWSAFNRMTTEFLAPHDPSASRRVYSPHLTFHPPEWLHLTEQKGSASKRVPFEAIAPIELAVRQQGIVPWVRFTSKPLSKITPTPVNGKRETIEIQADLQMSVRISVDFVPPGDSTVDPDLGHSEWFDHGDYRVRVALSETPAQAAALGWIHQN